MIPWNYNIRDHFWLVTGDGAEPVVWSSKLAAAVPEDDTQFSVWQASGGIPTRIESMLELRRVLADQYPDGIDAPAWVYTAYLKAALSDMNKLSAVNAAVQAAGPKSVILWDYATSVRLDDPDVVAIAGALSIDPVAVFKKANDIRKSRSA